MLGIIFGTLAFIMIVTTLWEWITGNKYEKCVFFIWLACAGLIINFVLTIIGVGFNGINELCINLLVISFGFVVLFWILDFFRILFRGY